MRAQLLLTLCALATCTASWTNFFTCYGPRSRASPDYLECSSSSDGPGNGRTADNGRAPNDPVTSRMDAMAAYVSGRGTGEEGPNYDRRDPQPRGVNSVDSSSWGSDEEQSGSSEEELPVYPIVLQEPPMGSGALSILGNSSALLVTLSAMLVLI